ncbi:FAD-binding oxidoreductase [Sediminibacter sp. Hel_I_10]|uniref:NAD(P)/FAD-dependent oxidoreductase n=1 Tax=Sediminibacter sp. Hel_I_10 TaxID=1392490 RepID=UPI00047A1CA9|nr:FAD-dependent oxidoreductase [Sediminibacter sp. Hel_I_10]
MKLRSSEPFWLEKNGIVNSYPSLRKDLVTDILIVGGGITGSLIAHQCIKDGYKTALIDKREIAHGSTSATTSMLQYEIDVPLHELMQQIGEDAAVANYKACSDSIDTLGALSKKVKSQCGFEKKQSLYYAAYKKDVPKLKKEFEARKENGFLVKWLEADDILKTFGLNNTHGGILSEQGGSIDAFRLAHDILAYNHKKGLLIFDKTNITKVIYKKTGVTVKVNDNSTIRAKKLIYCNGFESTEIIKEKFVKLISTFAMVGERFEDHQEQLENTLFWNTADPYIYMRTTDDHRLLIGGEDEDYVDPEKRNANIGKKAEKLKKYLGKILPDYDFVNDFAWAGTFGETKDGLPYIGKHKDFPSTYFVLGFGGNGITFSVIGMDIIAALLRGETHPLEAYYKFGR